MPPRLERADSDGSLRTGADYLGVKVPEKRDLVISRKYQKQSEVRNLFVAQISGGNLAGTIFRYEVWVGDYEEQHKRKTSGNAYAIRRVFIEALLDLQEDGWTRMNSANYAHPQEKFFDPAQL